MDSNLPLNTGKIRQIYTDGGCYNTGNEGDIGSWAFLEPVDLSQGYVDVYGEYLGSTTNNRTEMLAVIEGIKYIGDGIINVISDSGYVVKGYSDPSYLQKWIVNDWRTSNKTPVQNKDLWEQMMALSWHSSFNFTHIRGHKKDKNPIHAFWNDICDKCCTYIMHEKPVGGIRYHLRYDFGKKIIEEVVE